MSQLCYLHQLREMRVHLKFEEWNKRGYITQGALRGVMGSLANQANVQKHVFCFLHTHKMFTSRWRLVR